MPEVSSGLLRCAVRDYLLLFITIITAYLCLRWLSCGLGEYNNNIIIGLIRKPSEKLKIFFLQQSQN
jgi:hypothetical protein